MSNTENSQLNNYTEIKINFWLIRVTGRYGYFVTKYILKADYPTSGSEFDIFSGWIRRCLK